MPSEIPCEMRDRAYRICRDYLHGAWKLITPREMILKQISGGLSNMLYYCALPVSHPPKASEPSEVLLRIYGQVHGENAMESILAESVIFALLSERRLGPRLHGIFPGGRLEQYIPARPLSTSELADPELSFLIASKMANIHSLNVPISKEPSWMWNTMEKWLKASQEFLSKKSTVCDGVSSGDVDSKCVEKLCQVNYTEELDYLRQVVAKIQSPVVFAHNDMQEGNLLLKRDTKGPHDRICLIDFEYCSYNYRGFDLANHFCEWMYEYKLPVHPYFTVDKNNFPAKEKQVNFIRAYLAVAEKCRKEKAPTVGTSTAVQMTHSLTNGGMVDAGCVGFELSSHPAEDTLLQEVKVFTLTSHLFWALWSMVQGQVSSIPFGYVEYAATRMEHYFEDKANLHVDQISKRKSEAISEGV